jgi:lipopolysaccharide exporter
MQRVGMNFTPAKEETSKVNTHSLSDKRSVLTLISGAAIGQLINVLFIPITTRLFSPEVFGALSVFSSITGIVSIVVCLRYELGIIIPKEESEAFSILLLSVFFAVMVSGISFIVFLFFGKDIYSLFNAPQLTQFWYFVPLFLLLAGISQASSLWLTRKKKYRILSFCKVIPVLVTNLFSVGFGLLGDKNIETRLLALVLGSLSNVLLALPELIIVLKSREKAFPEEPIVLVKRYKSFLLFDVWGALLNNMSWMIIPIFMNSFFSSSTAGYYSISMRVVQLPASIIGYSITQIFLKNSSEKMYSGKLYNYSWATMKKLCIYSFPFALVILFFGNTAFSIVFGPEWSMGGVYSQILAPWSLVWFCASPMHSIFTITQKQSVYLIFSIVNLATRVGSMVIGGIYGNAILGLCIFSCSGCLVYGASIFISMKIAKKSDLYYSVCTAC